MTDAGSKSFHRCQVMSGSSTTQTNSDNGQRRDICAMGMDGRRSMGSVRKWRYGGRDHFWMLLVFLFSSSLLWISAQYKWRQHGFLPPSESIKLRWIFLVRRICRNVAIELYRLVVALMSSYDCVHTMFVSFFVSLSFSSLILALAAQEVCA